MKGEYYLKGREGFDYRVLGIESKKLLKIGIFRIILLVWNLVIK
jgi:hypothetical protein